MKDIMFSEGGLKAWFVMVNCGDARQITWQSRWFG